VAAAVNVRCVPLDEWVGPRTAERRANPFDARWETVLGDFDRELWYLGAGNVRIGLEALPYQIRMDGWPKAGSAIPPPVVVTFDSLQGPLRFACDRYKDWKANLRAIGLTLHRLRLVEEAGVAQSGEQYRGFAALPPAGRADMTVHNAARVLASWSDPGHPDAAGLRLAILTSQAARDIAYRKALKIVHPDHGGRREDFDKVQAAKQILDMERPL
jgi:hypothetical protein